MANEKQKAQRKFDLLWALNALLGDDTTPPAPGDHLLDGSGDTLTDDAANELTNG